MKTYTLGGGPKPPGGPKPDNHNYVATQLFVPYSELPKADRLKHRPQKKSITDRLLARLSKNKKNETRPPVLE
tara:strand:+ start:493 stop:711 length:219 start_codon:yes stop_codon:yes gene_type:complete